MTVSREQLKCRKYLWGWEESTEDEACTVHLMLHGLGGRMSTFWGVRQKRLLLLSSEMKSCCTARCFLPATPQSSPPFLPWETQQQKQSPSLSHGLCQDMENVEKHGADLNLPLCHFLSVPKVLVQPAGLLPPLHVLK